LFCGEMWGGNVNSSDVVGGGVEIGVVDTLRRGGDIPLSCAGVWVCVCVGGVCGCVATSCAWGGVRCGFGIVGEMGVCGVGTDRGVMWCVSTECLLCGDGAVRVVLVSP